MTLTKFSTKHDLFRVNDGQEHSIYVTRHALNVQHLAEYTPLEILFRCFVPSERFQSDISMMGDLFISAQGDEHAKDPDTRYVLVGMIYQGKVIPCNLEVKYGDIFKAPANNIQG